MSHSSSEELIPSPYSVLPRRCSFRSCGRSPLEMTTHPPPWSAIRDSATIECRNLSFSAKNRNGTFVRILNDCSLRVPSGQFWMLIGPNGCGKSTLLKFSVSADDASQFDFNNRRALICIFGGLLKPNGGYLHVKKPQSFVFQNPDHQVVMPTVEADVAFGLGKFSMANDEITCRVAKALDAVVQTLSGGQKQRVAVAGALAEACKVLLLDELTSFLDENDQIGVIRAVKGSLARTSGTTALWVTHRSGELDYADGAVYMEDGRIVLQGNVSTIWNFVEAQRSAYITQINS